MPKDENSAVEDFLGSLNKQDKDPFKSSDPFAQINEEEVKPEVAEEIVEDEKPLPFHKDPKVQRFIDKEISKRMSEVKPQTEVQRFKDDTQDEITAVLERVIGNDTPEKIQAVKDMRRVMGNLEERGAERAMEQLRQQAAQQEQEDKKAQDELDSSFEEIEDSFGVDLSSNSAQARKTRSEFVDYIRKIAPKNEEGEVIAFPDLTAAFEEFQERSKRVSPQASRAKQLAARSMSTSTDATQAPKATGNSWKDVDKYINNLTS